MAQPKDLGLDTSVTCQMTIAAGLDYCPSHFPNRQHGLDFLGILGWPCHCPGHQSSQVTKSDAGHCRPLPWEALFTCLSLHLAWLFLANQEALDKTQKMSL